MKTFTPKLWPLSLCIFVCSLTSIYSQTLLNGDLNGAVLPSSAPTSWAQVPFTDPVTQATGTPQATSDVTSTTGPAAGFGINGNPYSGSTFVSGLHLSSASSIWQEGIQQTVSGFSIGGTYEVTFYQAVVKQNNATDPSGSWSLYFDNTFAGTTAPTTSFAAPGSNSFIWERRVLSFTATSNTHTLKFLPQDDDFSQVSGADAIRMGIDSVGLSIAAVLPSALSFQLSGTAHTARLTWMTTEAHAYSSFVIERSNNGVDFQEIDRLPFQDIISWEYEDKTPLPGVSWYRLGQVVENGLTRYAAPQSIQFSPAPRIFVSGHTLYLTGGVPGESFEVAFFDALGAQVHTVTLESQADVSGLAQGVYLLKAYNLHRPAELLTKKEMIGY